MQLIVDKLDVKVPEPSWVVLMFVRCRGKVLPIIDVVIGEQAAHEIRDRKYHEWIWFDRLWISFCRVVVWMTDNGFVDSCEVVDTSGFV